MCERVKGKSFRTFSAFRRIMQLSDRVSVFTPSHIHPSLIHAFQYCTLHSFTHSHLHAFTYRPFTHSPKKKPAGAESAPPVLIWLLLYSCWCLSRAQSGCR